MLSIAERRKYILDSLNRYGFVRVADMAAEMNVTKATVRKDMEFLESKNLLYPCARQRQSGQSAGTDVSVHVKSNVNSEIKQKIAAEAAKLISCQRFGLHCFGFHRLCFRRTDSARRPSQCGDAVAARGDADERVGGDDGDRVGRRALQEITVGTGELCGAGVRETSFARSYFSVRTASIPTSASPVATARGGRTHAEDDAGFGQERRAGRFVEFGRRGFGRICSMEQIDCIVTDDGISEQYRRLIEEAAST